MPQNATELPPDLTNTLAEIMSRLSALESKLDSMQPPRSDKHLIDNLEARIATVERGREQAAHKTTEAIRRETAAAMGKLKSGLPELIVDSMAPMMADLVNAENGIRQARKDLDREVESVRATTGSAALAAKNAAAVHVDAAALALTNIAATFAYGDAE